MKTARFLATACTLLILLGCGGDEETAAQVTVESEEQKTLYALGMAIANNGSLKGKFTAGEVAVIEKGLGDGLATGEPLVEMNVYGPKLSEYVQQRTSQAVPEGEAEAAPAGPVQLETDEQKTLYALGQVVASQTVGFFKEVLTPEEVALVKKGFTDGMMQAPPLAEMEVYGPKLDAFIQQLVVRKAEPQKVKGAAYVVQAAAEEGAVQTESGLVYKKLAAGTGVSPTVSDSVQVHYHGTLIDGTVFDSSVQRGEPVTFPLNLVVPGWQEGLQMMKVGGKARLVLPSDIAYGDQPQGPIPPGSTLVFEVELLAIK